MKGLVQGRGMQVTTVHAIVSLIVASRQPSALLDDLAQGKAGSTVLKQHRLAIMISLASFSEENFKPFGAPREKSAAPVFPFEKYSMDLRRFCGLVQPLKGRLVDLEKVLVVVVTTRQVFMKFPVTATGERLKEAICCTPPDRLQILDSLRYDPTSNFLDIALPADLTDYIKAERREDCCLVLLDVQAWQFVSKPMDL